MHLVYLPLSEISQTEYETASKFEKKFLKLVISRCYFVKKGNEMNRIITLAYTAIVLVAVAFEVCSLNSE